MSVQFVAHPQKEWFLSFYELEEEWIVGGYSGAGVDDYVMTKDVFYALIG